MPKRRSDSKSRLDTTSQHGFTFQEERKSLYSKWYFMLVSEVLMRSDLPVRLIPFSLDTRLVEGILKFLFFDDYNIIVTLNYKTR